MKEEVTPPQNEPGTAEEWLNFYNHQINSSGLSMIYVGELAQIMSTTRTQALVEGEYRGMMKAVDIVREARDSAYYGTVAMNQYGQGVKSGMTKAIDQLYAAAARMKGEQK